MPRKVLYGTVVSVKNRNTVVVMVKRLCPVPVLNKTIKKRKLYHANVEHSNYKVGDVINIRECRPVSKLKRWEVIEA